LLGPIFAGADLSYEMQERIQGWEGQTKGLLFQVIWEQGLIIDSNEVLASYAVDSQKVQLTPAPCSDIY
jgi:hypothetical protein